MSDTSAQLVNKPPREQLQEPRTVQLSIRQHSDVSESKGDTVSLQYSVHGVPRLIRKEVELVFPQLKERIDSGAAAKGPTNALDVSQMLIVPTFQKASVDLVQWGDEQQKEKDRLLESFVAWSKGVCERVLLAGKDKYWVDFIDPCSGYPFLGRRGNSTYDEVQGSQCVLRYGTTQVGLGTSTCHVLSHPQWGTSCYPATLFALAPAAVLIDAIEAQNKAMNLIK